MGHESDAIIQEATKRTASLVSNAFRRSIRRLSTLSRRMRRGDDVQDDTTTPSSNSSGPIPEEEGLNSSEEVIADFIVKPKTKNTLILNTSTMPRFGSFRIKKQPTFKANNQPSENSPCNLATQDGHFAGKIPMKKVNDQVGPTEQGEHFMKITSFEKRRRQNQNFGVALHANQSLFCPEQASQIEIELLTRTARDFIVQITAPNGEKSPPLSIHGSCTSARFSPSNVGCGHGVWRLEVFRREQAKYVPKTVMEINLRGCGLLVFEIKRSGELRLFDRLWLNIID